MARDGLFISYSHADKRWLKEFHVRLDPLVRRGLVLWDDTHLAPGTVWRTEIDNAISRCRVALLLVSPDFLASEFIGQWELGPLLKARTVQSVQLLWVHLRACLYEETVLGELQAAHDASKPLDSLPPAERGAVLVDICRRVRNLVDDGRPGVLPGERSPTVMPDAAAVRYALVLSGKVSIEDKPLVDALLTQLRDVAQDARLSLVQIRSGSIHLTLEGTAVGLATLQSACMNGELEARLGLEVHAIYELAETFDAQPTVRTMAADAADTRAPQAPRGAVMSSSNRLGHALSPSCVLVDVDATSKKQVFERAGRLFEKEHGIARATVTDNVFARERLGSTGLGAAVALPHGRIKGLQNPLAAVLRVQQAIPYDAPDDEPVLLLIFLLVPEAATQRHLEILSEIAEMLSDRDFREALIAERDASVVYDRIRRWMPLQSAA